MGRDLIGRVASDGTVTEYSTPTAGSEPTSIDTGPDGNLWFTELGSNKIGRITTAGVITEYPVPTPDSRPSRITSGPDGNLWFTEESANKIAKAAVDGSILAEYDIPTPYATPTVITTGPDGNLWFTEWDANKVGRITTAGVITEFSAGVHSPNTIVTGPDGALWVAGQNGRIARIATDGSGTSFPICCAPGIATGSDGNLWITFPGFGSGPSALGRITTSGDVSLYGIPSKGSVPWYLTGDAGGDLWFGDLGRSSIGRFSPPSHMADLMLPGVAASTTPTGAGTLSRHGIGETARLRVLAGSTGAFEVRAVNNGATIDALTLLGTGSAPRFDVSYVSCQDVTDAVTDGSFQTAPLGLGESRTIVGLVTPDSRVSAGTRMVLTVQGASVADPSASDTVRVRVVVGGRRAASHTERATPCT